MMLELNKIRNAANAYYLLQTEASSDSLEIDYQEKFKLNWDLYKGAPLSEKDKGKFHL